MGEGLQQRLESDAVEAANKSFMSSSCQESSKSVSDPFGGVRSKETSLRSQKGQSMNVVGLRGF